LSGDRHLPVNTYGLPGGEFNLANELLKSRSRDLDLIDAGFQVGNGIIPRGVG